MKTQSNAGGTTNPRVRAALDGKLSPADLREDEQIVFYSLLAQRNAIGNVAFAEKLRQEAGNVGYDEDGNLIKTLGDGKVEILKRPD